MCNGSRWFLKVKHNADGSLDRYKGRVVAKGYSQQPGFDFKETFAPTVHYSTIRTILGLAALEDLELRSVNISHAYLNGILEEEIYMQQPEGIEVGGPEYVCRLIKSLYGLKQAGRVWNRTLHAVLTSMGFSRVQSDHGLYILLKDGTSTAAAAYANGPTQNHWQQQQLISMGPCEDIDSSSCICQWALAISSVAAAAYANGPT